MRVAADDGLTKNDSDYTTSKSGIEDAIKTIQTVSASVLKTRSIKLPAELLNGVGLEAARSTS